MRVPRFVAVIAAAIILVAGAGSLVVAHGGDPTLVHSCVNRDGEIRVVSAAASCKREEIALDWNVTGPIGATGPKGADGATGARGADGTAGRDGAAGRDGVAGRDGAVGAKGDTGAQGLAGKSGANNEIVVGQLSVTGTAQGAITGGDGAATLMDVRSFNASVTAPRDLASGQATGRRQYKPLVVTKKMDAATPLLHKALATNEALPSVVLVIYRPGTTTAEETITLTNATVSEIGNSDSGAGDAIPLETLSFTFQTIKYEFNFGGVTRFFQDSPFLTP